MLAVLDRGQGSRSRSGSSPGSMKLTESTRGRSRAIRPRSHPSHGMGASLPREHRPHGAVEREERDSEHDTPERHGRIERAPRHVVGSGGGAGGTVPGGSVRSHSTHAVPKGAKRGLKMANVTPAPVRLQNTHTGAAGLGLGAFTTTRGADHGRPVVLALCGRARARQRSRSARRRATRRCRRSGASRPGRRRIASRRQRRRRLHVGCAACARRPAR
jgi:hypothetical protein